MRLLQRFPVPLLAAALAGCIFSTEDRVASGGAQDFPNTLGTAASTHINDHSDWDQFSVIPSSLPTFSDAESLVVAPETLTAKPKAGLPASPKAAATVTKDTVFWDLSDTATLKVARRIHEFASDFRIKNDTLTWRYDEKAKDNVLGNELLLESKGSEIIVATGRATAYRYENTDSAGGFDRATFFQKTPALLPLGFKLRLLILLASPDGKFDLDLGARPAYFAYARTKTVAGAAPDTVESFDITDVDGDGALWGAGDSGVVDFRQRVPNPASRPNVDLVVQRMRAVLFKQENKTYPISYRETRTEKDGKKVVFAVHGVRDGADSTFQPGDTAWVSVQTDFPADAKMVEKTARYKVLLGGQPKRFSDNQLLRYTLDATWHKGDSLVSTRFSFVPAKAVPSGELSISGELNLSADLANGHSAEATGTFANKIIDADVKDTDKAGKVRRFHAKWSDRGALISQKPLP